MKKLIDKIKAICLDDVRCTFVFFLLSLICDLVFIIYNIFNLVTISDSSLWYSGQVCFYSILAVARTALLPNFIKRIKKSEESRDILSSSISVFFLFILGAEMILLSQLIHSQSVPLGGSGFIVLFNGYT